MLDGTALKNFMVRVFLVIINFYLLILIQLTDNSFHNVSQLQIFWRDHPHVLGSYQGKRVLKQLHCLSRDHLIRNGIG